MDFDKDRYGFGLTESASQRLARELASLSSAAKLKHDIERIDGIHIGETMRQIAIGETAADIAARSLTALQEAARPPIIGGAPGAAAAGYAASDMAQMRQWQSAIAALRTSDIDALYPRLGDAASAARLAQDEMQALFENHADHRPFAIGAAVASLDIAGFLGATSRKMSVLACVNDMFGIETPAYEEARQGLLGAWHSRPDLPDRFHRDPVARRDYYRDAEVDPGLIEATPPELVEVVIESGLFAGERDDDGSVTTFGVGGMTVTIRSAEPHVGAFRAISAFEQDLRAFISAKFEAKLGAGWFKHRVDGNTAGNARKARTAALKSGESEPSLIAFVDLGDLKQIILAGNNWDAFFGDIFRDKARFQLEMDALVAIRRPTMHSRNVDAVRLCELMLAIQRLSEQMADNGRWREIADGED